MATGFILRLYDLEQSLLEEKRFAALPIRIGRSSLNDLQVSHRLVSEFHARIEELEGKLCVRDLSSKNGVLVAVPGQDAPEALAAQTPRELEPLGFEFLLSPALRVVLSPAPADADARRSQAQGSVLGNPRMLSIGADSAAPEDAFTASFVVLRPPSAAATPPPAAPAAPSFTPPPASVAPARASAAPSSAPAAPPAAFSPAPPPFVSPRVSAVAPVSIESMAKLPALSIRSVSDAGQGRGPNVPVYLPTLAATAWDPAVPVRPLGSPGSSGLERAPSPAPAAAAARDPLEVLALRGLRELAASLLPGQPVETTSDVAGLITKLHDSLEIFCRCFIPVREGCSRFVPPGELERAALERSRRRSRAYLAVERAAEPRAVAAALLDWRDPAHDAVAAVENIFADLVFQQLALQEGALRGARALLDELSPDHIASEFEASGGRGALSLFSGRYRALWESYAEQHHELSAAREAFLELFGPEFTAAFQRYWRRRSSADATE